MKKMVMDKRGAVVSDYLTYIIVAAVVIFIVLVFATDAFGYFSSTVGKANIDTTAMSVKCNAYLDSSFTGLASGYCTDRIEIGTDKYVNCEYVKSAYGIAITGTAPDCTGSEKKICNKLKDEAGASKFKDTVEVNGKTCASLGVVKESTGDDTGK